MRYRLLNLDVLAFIDHNITVNVIKDGEIKEKRKLELPRELVDVIKCTNPRCITSIEHELPHIFYLADEEREIYRCKYCDVKYEENDAGVELIITFPGIWRCPLNRVFLSEGTPVRCRQEPV